MKILVVCQYYKPEPFRIHDLCEQLAQRGHSVSVLTGVPNYPEGRIYADYKHRKRHHETLNGVDVHRCFTVGRGNGKLKRFFNYYSFCISSSLKVLTNRCKPADGGEFDVVLVEQLSPVMMAYAGTLYKKLHKKRLILHCFDLWPESLIAGGVTKGSLTYRFYRKISAKIYSKCDRILVTSRMFIDYMHESFGIDKRRIAYLPQYTDDVFDREHTICAQQKYTYDFVFAGYIGEAQSIRTIIEAAKIIEASGSINDKKVYFHIIGSGKKLKAMERLAQGLSNIKFYGRRPLDDMPAYYAMADAMLVTLDSFLSRTLPGKIQSYMAAGKPIIGAIDGETEKIIDESGCGYVSKAGDSEALARNIMRFCMLDEDKKREFGRLSRQYYKDHFDRKTHIDNMEKYLSDNSDVGAV